MHILIVSTGFNNSYYPDPSHLNSGIYNKILCLVLDFITKFMYNFVINKQIGEMIMPTIKSSADLRNGYNEISTFCHTYNEPVFITKNGKGDLAVMSIEDYETLIGKLELYNLIKDGLDDVANGKTRPFSDAMADIRARRKK